jgi:hypothetical protein
VTCGANLTDIEQIWKKAQDYAQNVEVSEMVGLATT